MYTVDAQDRVIELEDVPQSSTGAPDPMIYATEQSLCLAYIREYEPGEWNQSIEEGRVPPVFCILVEFERPWAHLFGPPNDEALDGHPLEDRGLDSYGAYEVVNSSWIRTYERMNRVHRYHDPARYSTKRHFIFTFHDSTFECIAEGFRVSVQHDPSVLGAHVRQLGV